MKYNALTRRMFLQGSGGSLMGIPLLPSLLPKVIAGPIDTPVKRFISIVTGYDMGHHAAWLPTSASPTTNIGQPSRVFAPGNGHHAIRYQPLRDYAPSNSSVLSMLAGSALSPYLESTTIMRSLDFTTSIGHGGAHVLGGLTGDRSINTDRGNLATIETADVVLNKNRNFNPAGLPLIFCGNPGYGPDAYSYTAVAGSAANTANIGDDLNSLYNRLFSNGTFPQGGGGTVAHPKYDMLSRVLTDYSRVRSSRNISAADRLTLDNAFDQISDAQRGLVRVSTASCSYQNLPHSGLVSAAADNAATGRVLADLIAASIMCDSARVFTIGAPYLSGTVEGQTSDHEAISHVPFANIGGKPSWQISASRQAAAVRNFVAPLLQRLSGATDPSNGRSYLYNSLVYFTTENGIAHGWGSHPVTLIGNAGGALTSGNYIDYANRAMGTFNGGDNWSGTPGDANFSSIWYGVSYNRLMVTILQAMGLTPAEYEINSLNSQLYGRTDLGPNNRNLTSIGGFGYALTKDIAGADTNSWGFNNYIRPGLEKLDLRQFRNPLPMPTT